MKKQESFSLDLKKTFLFFLFCFVFVFLGLNIIQFFNFMTKQAKALVEFSPLVLTDEPDSNVLAQTQLPLPAAKQFPLTGKQDSIEIAALGLEVPLVFSQSVEIKSIIQDLKKGAVVYPGSGSPGQDKEIVILGHSSPPGWPKIRYDWIFSKLNDLEPGSEILINFEQRQYRYQIVKKIFLEKGEQIPKADNSGQTLYLITCWPPGKDFKRLAIQAVLSN